jgi:hypothetical protein
MKLSGRDRETIRISLAGGFCFVQNINPEIKIEEKHHE